ncbi:GNAT superfamily N-acetyltransferase [Deinococcus metalli]|uniref:GNAT family N-acetyltransferase n=1 Tax=Deinococcus metalli TaxID=1141878 RepID=A0A7W8NQZ6_9DEIO|nr:GNAT family N-acetyltransferase [Deinococcus metalli]MBB5378381.1 GNAT superfamily N-acetyltransferase [Deinococcus metalli]GHF59326.1 GNAT family N-acetyltransferase [Deinococcus metalli]
MDATEPLPANTAFTLRPFQNADADAVARVVTASVRGLWTYRSDDFRQSAEPRRRLVAVLGNAVVATAHLLPFGPSTPDALRLDLAGDGAAFTPLYLALLGDLPAAVRAGEYTRLLGVTREDFPETMHFFHAAGFRNAWQSWGAHLDLRAFDAAAFQPLEKRLFLNGYEVERLRPDAPEADWDDLHVLHVIGRDDVPRTPATTPDALTRDELRATVLRGEAVFVTRWRGRIVASTRLSVREHAVESEDTVTHPAHRGRGVATTVKAHALGWARAEGRSRAGTGGAVLNVPMLRVNARLGYRVEPMWVTWERQL